MQARFIPYRKSSAILSRLRRHFRNIKTNGQSVNYFFEYGTDGDLSQKTATRTLSPTGGQTVYLVTDTINGLNVGARYDYRLVVQAPEGNSSAGGNEGGDIYEGKTISFDLENPAIENQAPILNENYLSVKARASIETHNLPSAYWVEYGANDTFTQESSIQTIDRSRDCVVSLAGLLPDTEYSYRFGASNGAGDIVWGETQSIKTPPFIVSDSFERDGYYDHLDDEDYDWPEFETEDISWSIRYFLNGERTFDASYMWGYSPTGVAMQRIEPTSPFDGERNYVFTFDRTHVFEESYEEERGLKGRVISPPFHLSQFSEAFLHFAYAAPSWDSANDDFRVYYKTRSEDEWMLIPNGEFLGGAESWTECALQLPNLSSEYQIMFEATVQFGWGLALDDVLITPERKTGVPLWDLY